MTAAIALVHGPTVVSPHATDFAASGVEVLDPWAARVPSAKVRSPWRATMPGCHPAP